MTNYKAVGSVPPGSVDTDVAERAYRRVRDYLNRHPSQPDVIEIKMEHGEPTLVLPRQAVVMFAQILTQLAAGQGVSVVPSHAELTTQQAANLLNVSRPFLIGLLDSGEIPHRKVGRHRRIRLADLQTYQRRDDAERRQAADDLSELTQDLGFYEK
ncbi:excisionase family DNA binding protein [Stackebrandtia endophytica]|uniref:Excisionase family DNA binding protein n=1 Tax=Stackebrandtia endophytica TaxID=1496996 RepID=A0A543AYG8_9ACTN|nr:helix-turn-helix domain-containing protein [Stackebrandtia endophytica]TQL77613.1 excisionase family DNA binding protein [Stackebrandtia endophytica]